MSELTHVRAPAGLAAGNGYSHVVVGRGQLVAISGQISVDESGTLVGDGDPQAQAEQVFANLRRCLAEVGADFSHVVKFTFYVTEIAYLSAIRAVRDQYVDREYPPASTAVQVAGLARRGLLMEIEALAILAEV